MEIAAKEIAAGKTPDVDLLLSQPILSSDAQFHHDAWHELNAEQPMFAIGMGGVLIPQRLTRETARADGVRLGLEGDALVDFVRIVKAIDALEWADLMERHAKRAAEDAKKNKPPTNK